MTIKQVVLQAIMPKFKKLGTASKFIPAILAKVSDSKFYFENTYIRKQYEPTKNKAEAIYCIRQKLCPYIYGQICSFVFHSQ